MAGKPDTVKVGSVSIPIYTNARGRYRSSTVAFYRDEKLQRRTFSDKEEAISEARVGARSSSFASSSRGTRSPRSSVGSPFPLLPFPLPSGNPCQPIKSAFP
jgi:hypothetical protein